MTTSAQTGGPAFAQQVDELTLARARRGDMQAVAALYERFGRACYNLALRILGNPVAAEDVVQEVFVKLIDAIAHYRGDAPFRAWLKRLTANGAIDQLRLSRRRDDDDPERTLAEIAAAPALGADAAHDIWIMLQRLPPRARAVLLLHELEGYTHRELAELFGQTESYSKSILARSIKRLHQGLEPGAQEQEPDHELVFPDHAQAR